LKIDIEKLKAEIGEKLREAREEANMSQEELASMLGLSKVGYGALERGKNLIGLQYLIMLTFILKKPITYFLPPFCVTPEEMNNLNLDPTFRRWAECYLAMPDEIRRGLVGTLERVAGLPPTRPFEPAPPAEE
jgi:transcriptional regulator with XRE-family HTH domain